MLASKTSNWNVMCRMFKVIPMATLATPNKTAKYIQKMKWERCFTIKSYKLKIKQ
jgi:hypothetical protein